jgi:hypothetical protein
VLPYPLCPPDLDPCDFFLVPNLNVRLRKDFDNMEDTSENTRKLKSILKEELKAYFLK